MERGHEKTRNKERKNVKGIEMLKRGKRIGKQRGWCERRIYKKKTKRFR